MASFLAQYPGELAALLAAFLWTLASALFGQIGKEIRPLELNLYKGGLAIALFLITMGIAGDTLAAIAPLALIYLLLSGVIGIGVGDTAYFGALKHLGARRTLLISILAPPLTGLIALIFLGEQLSAGAWLGILVTVLGVGWVITEKAAKPEATNDMVLGVAFALLGTLAQSIAVLLSRAAFTRTDVSPLQSTVLRLGAGEVFLLVAIAVTRQRIGDWVRGPDAIRRWLLVGSATVLGTYVAMFLQQLALAHAPAGIVQTLISTSPLFILPLAALGGEKVSLRAAMGAIIAMIGVVLLFRLS